MRPSRSPTTTASAARWSSPRPRAPLGVKALHGAEVDLEDGRHLTLLVDTQEGWRNLCHILTRAHAHTRDHDEPPPAVPLETLEAHAEGLVCLSGCARHGVHDRATLAPAARRLRARAALRRAPAPVPARRPRAQPRAGRARRPARARHGRHRRRPRPRARARAAPGRVRRPAQPHDARRVRARAARQHRARDREPRPRWPPASRTTRRRSRRRRISPRGCASTSRSISATATPARRTRRRTGRSPRSAVRGWTSATRRLPHRSAAVARLEEELRVIAQLNLAGFFLLHRDLLELARDVAVQVRGPDSARALLPPGRGRGSSVSSIVCYLTGLSHIDPVANDLFLGRFLNEELTALPDIDLDFPRDIREVLIPRIHDRYGRERSALVAAFPTFRSRGAIRELGEGARAAAGGARARGARGRAVRGAGRDGRRRVGARAGARRRPRRWWTRTRGSRRSPSPSPSGRRWSTAAGPTTTRSCPATSGADPRSPGAGRGSRGCATRPTGSRATSPSTRAG